MAHQGSLQERRYAHPVLLAYWEESEKEKKENVVELKELIGTVLAGKE